MSDDLTITEFKLFEYTADFDHGIWEDIGELLIVMEQQNDQRLNDLAGKIASIRQVTTDIYEHANDHSIIDGVSETFGNMLGQLRNSSGRLGRAVRGGHPIVKTSAMALGVIFGIYLLVHLFW